MVSMNIIFMDLLQQAYQTGLKLDENIFTNPVMFNKDQEDKSIKSSILEVFELFGRISGYEFDHFVHIFSKDSLLIFNEDIKSSCFSDSFVYLYGESSMLISSSVLDNMKQLFSNFRFDPPSIAYKYFFSTNRCLSSKKPELISKQQFIKFLENPILYWENRQLFLKSYWWIT